MEGSSFLMMCRFFLLGMGFVVIAFSPSTVWANLTVTLSEASDGSTQVEISGSGFANGGGSATFLAEVTGNFLGNDDNFNYLGTRGTLMGTVGGVQVPFTNGLRIIDGSLRDTFQFTIGSSYMAGVFYTFSGMGNFPTLPFSSITSTGTFVSMSGPAIDFAAFSLVIVAPDPTLKNLAVSSHIFLEATGVSASAQPFYTTNLVDSPQQWIPVSSFSKVVTNNVTQFEFDVPTPGSRVHFAIGEVGP